MLQVAKEPAIERRLLGRRPSLQTGASRCKSLDSMGCLRVAVALLVVIVDALFELALILWSFVGQGSSNAGPAVGLDGTVYWGNGYSHFGLGTGSTTFYAFSVNGK